MPNHLNENSDQSDRNFAKGSWWLVHAYLLFPPAVPTGSLDMSSDASLGAGKARIRQVASLPHAWLPGWAVKDGEMLHSWGPKNTLLFLCYSEFSVRIQMSTAEAKASVISSI